MRKIYKAVIIGSGAAAYGCADWLFKEGIEDIALVTENRLSGTSRNTGSDKQTYYKLSMDGFTDDSAFKMATDMFSAGSCDGEKNIAGNRLLDMLPAQLRQSYEHYVLEDEEALLPFVKAADKLSAHIKCLEEQKAGNTEFDTAARQTWEAMKDMERPELDWFLDNCLGAFMLNLDQL